MPWCPRCTFGSVVHFGPRYRLYIHLPVLLACSPPVLSRSVRRLTPRRMRQDLWRDATMEAATYQDRSRRRRHTSTNLRERSKITRRIFVRMRAAITGVRQADCCLVRYRSRACSPESQPSLRIRTNRSSIPSRCCCKTHWQAAHNCHLRYRQESGESCRLLHPTWYHYQTPVSFGHHQKDPSEITIR